MSSNVCWMVVIMMQWTGHWILIGPALWMGPSTHRKCLFVPSSSVSCRAGCVGVCMFSTVIIRTGACVHMYVCVCVCYSFICLLWLLVQSTAVRQDGSFSLPRMRSLCAQQGTSSPHRKWRRSWEGKGSSSATPTAPAPALPVSSSMIRVLSQEWTKASLAHAPSLLPLTKQEVQPALFT